MGSSNSHESGTKKSTKSQQHKAPTISSSDKVKLQLKLQRDNLTALSHKYEKVSCFERNQAKAFLAKGERKRALFCLRREKMQLSQIEGVTAMLDNVQQLINTIDFMEVEAEVFNSLKEGNGELKRLNEMLNIDDIERLMDETAESIEEAQQIDCAMKSSIAATAQYDDDELLAELMANVPNNESDYGELAKVTIPKDDLRVEGAVHEKRKERIEARPVLADA